MVQEDDSLGESSPLLTSIKQRRLSESDAHILQIQDWKRYEGSEDLLPGKAVEKTREPWKRYIGLSLGVIASIFLSLTTLIAKLLAAYHPFNEALWRFTGILIPSIPVLLYFRFVNGRRDLSKSIWPLNDRTKLRTFGVLLIRAFFGCSAVICQFYALTYIAIGDVTVISFSTPVFVTILAYFVLGEKLGFVSLLAAILTTIGIVVISRPPIFTGDEQLSMETIIGVFLALGCMLFATVTYIALRWLREVDYAVVTVAYGFISVVECAICALITSTFELPQSPGDWGLAIGLAIMAFLGQTFFTLALKFEDAGPVSLIRTLEVPLTFLWQVIFLSELPDQCSIIGGLLILFSVVITGLRKWVSELPENSRLRQRLWFVLK